MWGSTAGRPAGLRLGGDIARASFLGAMVTLSSSSMALAQGDLPVEGQAATPTPARSAEPAVPAATNEGDAHAEGAAETPADAPADTETAAEAASAGAAAETPAPAAPDAPQAVAHCDAEGNAACQPCKPDKTQTSCCDPAQDPLCIDTSTRVLGVPVPIYNPQLDFALGAIGMVTYHPFKGDKVSPPWATMLFAMYSTNNSGVIMARQEAYWDEDNNRAALMVGGGKVNSDFYGTGDVNSSGVAFPLGSAVFMVQPQYLRRIWNRLYLGARYRLLWNEAVLSAPDDGDPATPPTFEPIESELLHSGLGVLAEFDDRDNRFSATKGFYIPFTSMLYSEAFGGQDTFANMDLAVNYYHSWFQKRLILATRGYFNIATNDMPQHMKPAVGAGPDLRGYAYGRYRDNLFMSVQTELRWYFGWKFGAVAFTGIGTTAAGVDRLGEGTVLPSYGLGLRFMPFEAQRMVVRVDYGRGNEDGQIYFSVSEAF